MSHCYDDFPVCICWVGILEIKTEHIRCFSYDLYVLDYRKVQDAIFLEVFTFNIFCEFKDFVYGLKNVRLGLHVSRKTLVGGDLHWRLLH